MRKKSVIDEALSRIPLSSENHPFYNLQVATYNRGTHDMLSSRRGPTSASA